MVPPLKPLGAHGSPFNKNPKVLAPVCVAGGNWSTGLAESLCFLQLVTENKIINNKIAEE